MVSQSKIDSSGIDRRNHRTGNRGGIRASLPITNMRCTVFLAFVTAALMATSPAHAEAPADATAATVDDLARTLASSKQHKARIGAAVSLGRLGHPRTLRPLIAALRDEHRVVRAVAAAALGRLGDASALASLQRATRDRDEMVRDRARDAIAAIRAARSAKAKKPARGRRPGFGNQPRALPDNPEVYVVVRTARDQSPGTAQARLRGKRATEARAMMTTELQRSPQITTDAREAKRGQLAHYQLDLAIVGYEARAAGRYVEVEVQLRVAVSDARGKMLSFVSGGAKVQIPRGSFNRAYLPMHRREALENAVKGIHQDLLRYLRLHTPS